MKLSILALATTLAASRVLCGDAPCTYTSEGENRYFILKPGYRAMFQGEEDGKPVTLVVTVTYETKTVAGVATRVVEERETHGGKLAEVSRNYFAICKETNDAMYFGEHVDIYRGKKVVGHGGSWLAGERGALPGVIMPGTNAVGARYAQEAAPKVAMDQAETIALDATVTTPSGTFKDCLVVKETNPLEHGAVELKRYAPGVGLVQDARLQLIQYGMQGP